MQRKIYYLNGWTVDSNGAWNQLSGTPQTFDSKNYNGDTEKTLRRAIGARGHLLDEICKVDNRKLQTVTLTDETGFEVEKPYVIGSLYEPDPEPEPEPEE